MTDSETQSTDVNRRNFLATIGAGAAGAALGAGMFGPLLDELRAASGRVSHHTPAETASDEDFWSTIQQSFSVTRNIVNLNNGGVCPSPRIVTEAFVRYTWEQEELPAYVMWQVLEPRVEHVREGLARLFGVTREEIAITRNASESLEIILFGLGLKSGDEILTSAQDYPRMLTTLRQREIREGISLNIIPIATPPRSLDEIVGAFEKAITAKTRVILLSQINFANGQIMPVKAIGDIARSRGIELVVDGAHAFAHLDYRQSDLGCDYFGTSLHKWLYAPKGTGMLFVKKEKIASLYPLMAADRKQADDIRKFEEIGTHSAAPRLAIAEAIVFHHGIGAKRKEARLRFLSRYWQNRVREFPNVRFHTSLDEDQSCALGTVEIAGIEPSALQGHLFDKHKIYTTTMSNDAFKGIRVTPNVYTTLEELDRFCDAMETAARRGLPK